MFLCSLFFFNFQNIKIFCSLFLTQTRYQVSSCLEALVILLSMLLRIREVIWHLGNRGSAPGSTNICFLWPELSTFINTCQQHSPFLFYQSHCPVELDSNLTTKSWRLTFEWTVAKPGFCCVTSEHLGFEPKHRTLRGLQWNGSSAAPFLGVALWRNTVSFNMSLKGQSVQHHATCRSRKQNSLGQDDSFFCYLLFFSMFCCFQDPFFVNGLPVAKWWFRRNMECGREDEAQRCEANQVIEIIRACGNPPSVHRRNEQMVAQGRISQWGLQGQTTLWDAYMGVACSKLEMF